MLLKRKEGQSTVEYALIIGVIVAALVGMQTYVKRGLQARYHDGMNFLSTEVSTGTDGVAALGATGQYEPYYQNSDYSVTQDRNEDETVQARGHTVRTLTQDDRTRAINGFEESLDTSGAD